jgi:hypothetical protein
MFGRLLPRETSFFDFFERHGETTKKGTAEFMAMVSEGGNIAARAVRIKEIEHEADTITHRCVEALHKTFITPIERDDIYRLISRMDDVMDYIEAAAERLTLYRLTEMTPEVQELARVLVRCADILGQALHGLRDLKNADAIVQHCIEINQLENEADVILRRAVARLFDQEQDVRLIIKWKEIYEHLENATDRCEDVANIIEGVVLEHA